MLTFLEVTEIILQSVTKLSIGGVSENVHLIWDCHGSFGCWILKNIYFQMRDNTFSTKKRTDNFVTLCITIWQ